MRAAAVIALLCLTLAACGGGGGGGGAGSTGNSGGGTTPLALDISPASVQLDPGQTQAFSATGGQAPYTFAVVSGAGTIDASGHYTAPAAAGSAIVKATDASGTSAQANIAVNAPFVTSSSTAALDGGTQQIFAATGGKGPYVFSVVSGGGSIDPSTGIYTAPATAGTVVIQIVDALGSTQQITVTVAPRLGVYPGSVTLTAASGQSFTFAGQGGTPPYTYALTAGPGSVAADGTYTVGPSSGTSMLTITDQLGTTVGAQVRSLRIRVNGPVWATVSDGTSWYLGGSFSATNPYSTPRMAILDATSGAPQLGCDLQAGFLDGNVNAVARVGSSIYVGGSFLHYRGVAVNNLVKIDATTCALDTTFGQSGGVGGYAQVVNAILVSGQSLYVAGNFSQYRTAPVSSLIKIDAATGALDTSFSPGAAGTASGYVSALALNGTSLYIGGGSSLNVFYLIKIDAGTGALDPAFGSGNTLDGDVESLAVNGSSLYAGGSFAHMGSTRVDFAKLDLATGAVDPTFANTTLGYTNVDAIAPSGTALYLGRGPGSAVPAHLAKIDSTSGATDTTFTQIPSANYGVNAIAVAGSSLYVGGSFTTYRNSPAHDLAKIDATTGALDTTFTQSTGANDQVDAVAVSGNTVYAGGAFSTYRGAPIAQVAKFAIATDEADPTFSAIAGPNSAVLSLALVGSSLYLAGPFTAVNGQNVPSLAKIDATTGTLDTTFSQPFGLAGGFAQSVLSVNGALYVGGSFQTYRGTTTGSLVRLDPASGVLDTTFAAGAAASGSILALAAAGTSLYIGGTFTSYGAQPAINLAKVDLTSAALDTTFTQSTGATGTQVSGLLLSGSSLYVAGLLQSYRGTTIGGIAKVNATSGVLDTTFSTNAAIAGGNSSNTFALDGSSLYVGGEFAVLGGITAQNLAKVDATSGGPDPVFTGNTGVCNAGAGTPACGGIIEALTLQGTRLYISAYAGTLYRGAPAYFFYPVDAASGQLLDP